LVTHDQKTTFSLRPLHKVKQLSSTCKWGKSRTNFVFATQRMGRLFGAHGRADEYFGAGRQLTIKPFSHAGSLLFTSRRQVSGHVIAHQLQINGFGMTP
jgi:hypothetical protein